MTQILPQEMLDAIKQIDDEALDILVARELQEGHATIKLLGEPFLEQIIAGKALRNIQHREHEYMTDDDLLDLINYARFQLLIRRGELP